MLSAGACMVVSAEGGAESAMRIVLIGSFGVAGWIVAFSAFSCGVRGASAECALSAEIGVWIAVRQVPCGGGGIVRTGCAELSADVACMCIGASIAGIVAHGKRPLIFRGG